MQVESSDAAAAMQLFEDVAYGDVEQGSIYDLSEANLIKVKGQAMIQVQFGMQTSSLWGVTIMGCKQHLIILNMTVHSGDQAQICHRR